MNDQNKLKLILPKNYVDPKKTKKRLVSSPISFMKAVESPDKQPKSLQQNFVPASTQLQTNNQVVNTSTNNQNMIQQPTGVDHQNLELLDASLDLDAIFGADLLQQPDSELDKMYQECSNSSNIPINVLSACINFYINNFINNPSGFFENCL